MAADDPLSRLWAYFSIDVAGSTNLKVDNADRWSSPIIEFLRQAHAGMSSTWGSGRSKFNERLQTQRSTSRLPSDPPPAPRTWKVLGDEVVFVQEFRESRDSSVIEFLYSVHVFMDVLRSVRQDVRKQFSMPLELKGTIWLANEARNIQYDPISLRFPEEDFFGPGIDIGFRIKSYAEAKKIAFSVEAGYLFALGLKAMHDESAINFVNYSQKKQVVAPVIYLEGNTLPGVFDGGIPYPKILLRILPPYQPIHRQLVNKGGHVTAPGLEGVCEEWIDCDKRLFMPFRAEQPTGAVRSVLERKAREYNLAHLEPPQPT